MRTFLRVRVNVVRVGRNMWILFGSGVSASGLEQMNSFRQRRTRVREGVVVNAYADRITQTYLPRAAAMYFVGIPAQRSLQQL